MKQFNFKLQKLLDLRQHYEDEAKLELGRAVSILTDLENKLRVLGQEQARAAAAQFSPGNDAYAMQQYMYYLTRLENLKEQLLSDAAAAELNVEKARQAFIEASRERKVLDKLKEKRQMEYRKFVLTEEIKTMDDNFKKRSP